MLGLNRNDEYTCENFGTQTTKKNIVRLRLDVVHVLLVPTSQQNPELR